MWCCTAPDCVVGKAELRCELLMTGSRHENDTIQSTDSRDKEVANKYAKKGLKRVKEYKSSQTSGKRVTLKETLSRPSFVRSAHFPPPGNETHSQHPTPERHKNGTATSFLLHTRCCEGSFRLPLSLQTSFEHVRVCVCELQTPPSSLSLSPTSWLCWEDAAPH